MNRIRSNYNMIKKTIMILLFVSISAVLLANDLSVESYVEQTTIGLMDRLKMTIEISGSKANNVSAPELPQIANFRNLGYSTGSSSSYSFANGKATSTVTKKYTYTMQPQQAGRFVIPSFQIAYNKQTFTTDPITITVKEGSTGQAPPTSMGLRSNQRESDNISDNLYLNTIVSDRDIYEGEPITVEYYLYTRYDITNLSFGEDSGYKGFWKEDLFTPTSVNFTPTTENGQRFNRMLMKKIVLYPSSSGNLTLPPLQVNADIRTQSHSFFDFGSSKSYIVESKPIKIKVRQLPASPENFSGAVGKFEVKSTVNTKDLNVGDSFTFTMVLSGTGNFKQFELPELPEIKYLRFLDPEISSEISDDGISGKKTIKYLVIAQEQGKIMIPPIPFTYFDTSLGKYKTINSAKFSITVGKGDLAYIPSSAAQTTVQMEGSDIGFLVNIAKLNNPKIIYKSWYYWLIIVFLLLSIPASFIYRKEQDLLSSNQNYYRTKKADKVLRKYIRDASKYSSEHKAEFYVAAQTGLSNFLSDKMHIARGSTTEDLLNEIKTVNLDINLYDQISEMFKICNQARFMPGGFSDGKISDHHELLKRLVSEISKSKF